MNAITTVAQKEIISGFRNRSYLTIAVVLMLITALALIAGARKFKQANAERQQAITEQRDRWLHQDPKHPHIAAHFGNFAYMPKPALSIFDSGLDDFTGTVAYLEPHRQNEFAFKPAEDGDVSVRFGTLSVALILQMVMPLVAIFLSFSAFSQEMEQQTIALLYAQGLTFRQLYTGKFLGLSTLLLLLLIPVLVLWMAVQLWSAGPAPLPWVRLLLLCALYAGYMLIYIAAALLISAHRRNSKKSLLLLLGIYVFAVILMPKWAASTGNHRYTLPSKYEFTAALQADIAQGIDGHNPSGKRADRLKDALLKQYHVDTIAKLPFNFEGYVMQAGETYSSKVYDKHFDKLQHILISQNRLSQWCSYIDPYIAVYGLSMAFAGTDYYTHLDFQHQAEFYRRSFVQQMNLEMQNKSKLGDWEYKANRASFAQVPAFAYQVPGLVQSLRPYLPGLLSLLLWMGIILFYVYRYPVYLF